MRSFLCLYVHGTPEGVDHNLCFCDDALWSSSEGYRQDVDRRWILAPRHPRCIHRVEHDNVKIIRHMFSCLIGWKYQSTGST